MEEQGTPTQETVSQNPRVAVRWRVPLATVSSVVAYLLGLNGLAYFIAAVLVSVPPTAHIVSVAPTSITGLTIFLSLANIFIPSILSFIILKKVWPDFRSKLFIAIILSFLVLPLLPAFVPERKNYHERPAKYLDIPLKISGDSLIRENIDGREKNTLNISVSIIVPIKVNGPQIYCNVYEGEPLNYSLITGSDVYDYDENPVLDKGENKRDIALRSDIDYKHDGPYLVHCQLRLLSGWSADSVASTVPTKGVGKITKSCDNVLSIRELLRPRSWCSNTLTGTTGALQDYPPDRNGHYPLTVTHLTQPFRKEDLNLQLGERELPAIFNSIVDEQFVKQYYPDHYINKFPPNSGLLEMEILPGLNVANESNGIAYQLSMATKGSMEDFSEWCGPQSLPQVKINNLAVQRCEKGSLDDRVYSFRWGMGNYDFGSVVSFSHTDDEVGDPKGISSVLPSNQEIMTAADLFVKRVIEKFVAVGGASQ